MMLSRAERNGISIQSDFESVQLLQWVWARNDGEIVMQPPPRGRGLIRGPGIPMAADGGPYFSIPDVVVLNGHPVRPRYPRHSIQVSSNAGTVS